MASYDSWKTTEPDDIAGELCEHGKPHPCQYCKFDWMESHADMLREERAEKALRWLDEPD